MGIIIDVIIVAIIALSAYFAYKKGLIGTLFSLLGTVIAIVLAVNLCGAVSGFIDTNYVNPAVKTSIVKAVDASVVGERYEQITVNADEFRAKLEQMPQSLKSILDMAGISSDQVIKNVQSGMDLDKIINDIAAPISITISRVVALVGLFFIFFIALWIVTKLLTAVFSLLPVGKKLNAFGGLVFGILRGILIAFVIATLFGAVSKSVDPDSNNIFSKKTVESTYILKTIEDFNPITSAIN